jgi:6-phosphofructokinase 2
MSRILTLTPNPSIDTSTSVERIVPVDKLRCAPARRHAGGGGINVARVIHRLGSEVTAVYPRGGDTGDLLSQLVGREGIASETSQSRADTREDFSVYETTSAKQFRFVLPGPAMGEAEWRACLNVFRHRSHFPDFVVASGSLPPGAPADFYARACRIAKAWDAKFMLDTTGPALKAALAEGVHLIKPNLLELGDLVGEQLEHEADWVRACVSLVNSGQVEIVALSLGDQGALLVERDRVLRAQPLPIKPLSSVGAGDSFLGGLVWSLAQGNDMESAFRAAVAAGAAALLRPGTDLARPEDTHRLAAEVVVTTP